MADPTAGTLARRLLREWQQPGLLSALLLPAAGLFGALAALRRVAWRQGVLHRQRLPVPVIVIGNLTVGGVGKTPLVIALARHLQAQGRRPGIISRGYGGNHTGPTPVLADSAPALVGDEPLMLALETGCPVTVGRDRVAAAQRLLREHADVDVLLSDDGLQHYALARDLEIVVIDGQRGFGNGRLLPAGPLREPPARLATVDAVVINGGDFQVAHPCVSRMRLDGQRFQSLAAPQQWVGAEAFIGQNVHAIAGIGNPQRFFDTLTALGVAFTPHAFADHHAYTREELEALGAQVILMTAKDAVKCRHLGCENGWVLPVTATLDPAFLARIDHRLEQVHGSQTA